jgi:NADH:ubiquinone oxidoreductase subunit 3 (subunit A)
MSSNLIVRIYLIENCFRFNLKQEIFYFEIEIFSNNLFIMTLFYSEFSKVGILFLFSVFLASIILFLSYRLSTYNPDTEKVSAYECGFDPYDDARNVFDVRFYLVAILFIVFDLEAVYFFPWCVSLSFLNLDGLWGMIDFILELLIGFIYAWEVGALEWEYF